VSEGSLIRICPPPNTASDTPPVSQINGDNLAIIQVGANTPIKLFDIKCAWFNESQYCEFFPARYSQGAEAIDLNPPKTT
jgi:hypothetical protein